MRRKDREVTDFEKILRIVNSCDCCRLGLVDSTEAYIVPLSFGWEKYENTFLLYFHSAVQGRKLDLIPRQTLVSFEMDTAHRLFSGNAACQFSFFYQCVMGRGRLSLLNDAEKKTHAMRKIMEHYAPGQNWSFSAESLAGVTVLCLRVQDFSCKEHL